MRRLSELDREFAGLFDQVDSGDIEDDGEGSRRSGTGFAERYGWHINVEEVAEYERIPLAAVYELTIINFLNDLAYIKAKRLDERQRRIEHGR